MLVGKSTETPDIAGLDLDRKAKYSVVEPSSGIFTTADEAGELRARKEVQPDNKQERDPSDKE
jgi:hypothetical protein